MPENTNRWNAIRDHIDKTLVPVNYVALVCGVIIVLTSLWQDQIDVGFWFGVAILLWALYDVVKWRRRKRAFRQSQPIGPEDSPDWK